jgi:hypothetical protein
MQKSHLGANRMAYETKKNKKRREALPMPTF